MEATILTNLVVTSYPARVRLLKVNWFNLRPVNLKSLEVKVRDLNLLFYKSKVTEGQLVKCKNQRWR